MGKIRIKTLGLAEIEEQQKKEAEKRRDLKKTDQDGDTDSNEEGKSTKKSQKNKASKSKNRSATYKKSLANKKKESQDIISAVALVKKMKYAKFDDSVDIHIALTGSSLKGEVALPHGTGKKVRVAIATEDLIAKIAEGVIDFDILIATPADMPKLSKLARVLGPKGLMPNPKKGTVTNDPKEAVKKFEGGSIQYKSEPKFPLLHQTVGKISFTDEQLVANIQAFMKAVGSANVKEAYLAGSMTPSIKLSL